MLGGNLSFPAGANRDKPVRVCIRGIAGLLGSRIALAMAKNPDMKLVAGIARNDATLKEAIATLDPLPEKIIKNVFPERMFLDDRHQVVREVNASQHIAKFEPADQLNLQKECDVVIDAATPGSADKWMDRYHSFDKPVILQSGEYGKGRTMVPPLVREPNNWGKIYRQGDCVLSGVVPVLAPLAPLSEHVIMHILTQYTEKLNDYTTDQRLGTTYIREDVKEQVENELMSLLPNTNMVLLGVSQVSGLSYYTTTLLVETRQPMAGMDLCKVLKNKPRMRVVPEVRSTYEIAHFHKERMGAFSKEMPPITIFGSDLETEEKKTSFRIGIAIDYKYIAVLPNIDAVRMLVLGLAGEDAMRITDRNMGFA